MSPNRYLSIKLIFTTTLTVLSVVTFHCEGCDDKFPFEGFGSYLGSVGHLSRSAPGTINKVLDKLYTDLSLRYFRTAYEPQFSPSPGHYEIPNSNAIDSTFYQLHKELSNFSEISLVASIWSPPFYMKNNDSHTLLPEFEYPFLQFIVEITSAFKSTFNLTVERVSPVNEPENIFAPWDHTNMIPEQLCQMVKKFSSPLVSICPENSYFWVSELYSAVGTDIPDRTTCNEACEIFGTHSYALNTDFLSPNRLKAYYDLIQYDRQTQKPIWMMEVSSTYDYDHYYNHQMQEALDLSINIANFVGVTCIQRYYYWSSFTQGASGESLIWGNEDGTLYFPKKYFAYKHFTLASQAKQPSKVEQCGPAGLKDVRCTTFGNRTAVFSNNLAIPVNLVWKGQPQCKAQNICCTTNNEDWKCSQDFPSLPEKSVCSCELETLSTSSSASTSSSYHTTVLIFLIIVLLALVITNSLH